MKLQILILILVTATIFDSLKAQSIATAREYQKDMTTYRFSDPNPIPSFQNTYPYFRFDGYSNNAEKLNWKFIELENDYIKVYITPEIGGKIWGAVEKSTGMEFIYFNHVVKFRDIAMRGPWTSGGIETNFGVIGHAPTCSSPVDYTIRNNNDGSVSCFIGAIDLPSRTEWRIEVNLERDKSYFTTKATWHNPTSSDQAYYHWMNAGVKSKGNLEYAYPGTNYIGHDGRLYDWPIHNTGKDLSWYGQNNFGSYKSYHILGRLTNFFGGYWHDDDFGFGHYANYDGKPGKKLWIWGLSRQGMIWEDLLTDTDGQYTEIQSGRLFNQEAAQSIRTPFKHRSFSPSATDTWTEYWFPVMKTQGVTQASTRASINLVQKNDSLYIWISSNTFFNEILILESDGKTILDSDLNLKPTEVWHSSIINTVPKEKISVRIGDQYIILPGGAKNQELSRPLETVEFDWQSVQGMALEAKSLEQERRYSDALLKYMECLGKDRNYIPALTGAARLYHRKTEYNEGIRMVSRALSINAYDPGANFIYAVINDWIGNTTDAIDGYSIAAADPGYKSASFLGLARIYYRLGDLTKSLEYTNNSLANNNLNISAQELKLTILRRLNNINGHSQTLDNLFQQDPLNHYARFEKYLITNNSNDLSDFNSLIRNELPHETYLELAVKYFNLLDLKEADQVLLNAPKTPMVLYWRSYLLRNSDIIYSEKLLNAANELSPTLVFPFRQESIEVLKWASASSNSWKPKYYLAILLKSLGQDKKAEEQIKSIAQEPDFFPYYIFKSMLFADNLELQKESIEQAYKIAPDSWRVVRAIGAYYLENGEFEMSEKILAKHFKKHPDNYYIGLDYANILLMTGKNQDCRDLLQKLRVLPNEGATQGRHLFRIANLNLTVESLTNQDYDFVQKHLKLARSWPENLGVGMPYNPDTQIEDYLDYLLLREMGKDDLSANALQYITNDYKWETGKLLSAKDIICLAAFIQMGQKSNTDKWFDFWQDAYPNDKFLKKIEDWYYNNDPVIVLNILNYDAGSREYYLAWTINFLINIKTI